MFFRKLFSSSPSPNSATDPQLSDNSPPSRWSHKFLQKECKFDLTGDINYFSPKLPVVYSPLFGLPSVSSYYECIQLLFSGHIPHENTPKFTSMYAEKPDTRHSASINPPFLRPSGLFTLLEVIPEPPLTSQKTDIGLGKIRLSDIVCTFDADTQFKRFYSLYKDSITFITATNPRSIQRYFTQTNFQYIRFLFREYVDRQKFIHYGSSLFVTLHNNRQYVLIHHPMFFQPEGFFFSAYSPKIQSQLESFSFRFYFSLMSVPRNTLTLATTDFLRIPDLSPHAMTVNFKMGQVTSHHMVSPLLYLNCLSQASFHILYSFIMVMMQAKNHYSILTKHNETITVVLQNAHFLDRTLFVTPDLVVNAIREYLKVDVNIILEGIDRQIPPSEQIRPVFSEYISDVSQVSHCDSYDDGFAGLANFTVSDINDDVVAAGHIFSNAFCTTFLTPIIEQVFFSSLSSTTSKSSQKGTSSNFYPLIHPSPYSDPQSPCLKSIQHFPPIQVPSSIPYPTSLISLYHSVYYNQCLQRQWHLFLSLGIQHLSLTMFTISLGDEPKLTKFGKTFNLSHSQNMTFEYLISSKPITSDDKHTITLLDSSSLQADSEAKSSTTLSQFNHISLPPPLCPLHSEYFNTSQENSTTLTPIFSLIEPSPTTIQTINYIEADMLSQLPIELTPQNDGKIPPRGKSDLGQIQPQTDLSIGIFEDRVQFYKFKYAGEVKGYKNLDYTANVHYFRCPITSTSFPNNTSPFEKANTPPHPDASSENDTISRIKHESNFISNIRHCSAPSTKKQLELRIISPDLSYPSRPCRVLPLSHHIDVPPVPHNVLFTLPMNQILALEYFLQHHTKPSQAIRAQQNTESTFHPIFLHDTEKQLQKEHIITYNSKKAPLAQDFNSTDNLCINPTSNPSFDDNTITSKPFSTNGTPHHPSTNGTPHHHPIHQSTTLPQSNSLLPLSATSHQYHHIELHNDFSSTIDRPLFIERAFKPIFFYPFSCPGVVLLTPYSTLSPFVHSYVKPHYDYTQSLVQIDINIPFFFVTVLPEGFDITQAPAIFNPNEAPFLGWDSTLSPDKLNYLFKEQQSQRTQESQQPQQHPSHSDLTIQLQKDLIFQNARHVKVFSTVIHQDMDEYIQLKRRLNSSDSQHSFDDDELYKQIKLTHSAKSKYYNRIAMVQHFLLEFEAQQAKEGKIGETRSMFHFIVSGMNGYFEALPFINKVALAHYISYRLQPQFDKNSYL